MDLRLVWVSASSSAWLSVIALKSPKATVSDEGSVEPSAMVRAAAVPIMAAPRVPPKSPRGTAELFGGEKRAVPVGGQAPEGGAIDRILQVNQRSGAPGSPYASGGAGARVP